MNGIESLKFLKKKIIGGSKMSQTAVEWFFDKIITRFEHNNDTLTVLSDTYVIAKQKEMDAIKEAYEKGVEDGFIKKTKQM